MDNSDKNMSSTKLLICIGDIHGHLDKLKSLWSNLQTILTNKELEAATVVFLGDYCDKGPDTKGVIDFLIKLEQDRAPGTTIFLAGNHDFAMAAYLDCLPVDNMPENFDLDETKNTKYQSGFFKHKVDGGMYYMGRRWGGSSSHKSNVTFKSYGVEFGYKNSTRLEFIAAVPQAHKDFLQRMHWIYETNIPDNQPTRVICTHAGLGSLFVHQQINAMKNRNMFDISLRVNPDYMDRLYFMSGRRNVLYTPKEIKGTTLLVSGHHGKVHISKNRIIMDNNAGKYHKTLQAILLPSKVIISSNE